jgi:hypothetical protein
MSDNVLEDFIEVDDFAKQVKRTTRTVFRWMNLPNGGLPYETSGGALQRSLAKLRLAVR